MVFDKYYHIKLKISMSLLNRFCCLKMLFSITIILAALMCSGIGCQYAVAQPANSGDNAVVADTLPYRPFSDTLIVKPPDVIDSARIVPRKTRTATRAALWSALLPGAGQTYNRQYWKTPLAAGAVVGTGILAIKYKTDYNGYKKQYDNELIQPALSNADFEELRQKKKNALKNYNVWGATALTLYGFNIADAYLSALIARDRAKHSPLKAAYYSALLPGLGQIYNRKYWKLPIVYAGFAGAGTAIYLNRVELNRFREEYMVRTRPGYGAEDPTLSFASDATLLKFYNRYKRYYEISIILGSVWYILNILDATIDAHLHDFDMSDDLSWHIRPYMDINPNVYLPKPHVYPSSSSNLPISAGLNFTWSF